MAAKELQYYEELSATGMTCPHEDAFQPDGKVKFYRVLKNNPATSADFLPTQIKEGKPKPDACIQKAVSVYDSLEGMLNAYFKTPAYKKKQRIIAVITLKPEDGKLKQTFAAGHHSWWRSHSFDPNTVLIEEVEA